MRSLIMLHCLILLTSLLSLGCTSYAAAVPTSAGPTTKAQLQELKQLVSMLLGAESMDDVLAHGLLPGTANTQRLVARQSVLWPQHFTFLSAVSADNSVTCSHLMTDKSKLAGAPLYTVLGDQTGRLYFFTPQGYLLHEFDTGISSSITALTSDLLKHNETHLLVGQADGTVTLLSIAHEHPKVPDGSGIRSIHAVMVSTAADRAVQRNDTDVQSHQQPIAHILWGASSSRRALLAVDASGRVLSMLARTGHVLMAQQTVASPPLAAHLNSNFQLVIQSEAATTILLMKRGRRVITRQCSGLAASSTASHTQAHGHEHAQSGSHEHEHGDRLVAAAFDPKRSFRAFGVTAAGELVMLVVPSGVAAHQCRVHQRVPLGLPPGHVHLVIIKGRLLLLHTSGVAAFDVSGHKVQLLGSTLVSHTWAQLWGLYGLTQQYKQLLQPLGDATGIDAASSSPHGLISRTQDSDDDNSSSSVSRGEAASGAVLLQAAGYSDPLRAAAGGRSLLLLPMGNRGMSVFASGAGSGVAGGKGGAAGKGSASGSTAAPSDPTNWAKLVQPFVVIMMIVVGVWQFVRASNKSSLAGRRAGRYGSGLSGLDSAAYMSRAQGLASSYMMQGELSGQQIPGFPLGGDAGEGLGSFDTFDRDFGAYAGPRGRRDRETPDGPLGALTARRRARAAMLSGRQAERKQQQAGREQGPGGAGGLQQRRGLPAAGGRNRQGAAWSDPGVEMRGAGRSSYLGGSIREEEEGEDADVYDDVVYDDAEGSTALPGDGEQETGRKGQGSEQEEQQQQEQEQQEQEQQEQEQQEQQQQQKQKQQEQQQQQEQLHGHKQEQQSQSDADSAAGAVTEDILEGPLLQQSASSS